MCLNYDDSMTTHESHSVAEAFKGSHDLVIERYSLTKGIGVGNHIASDEFSVGGHKWAIRFFPEGEDDSAYVSLFIALVSEGHDLRTSFDFTLIDQSGKSHFLQSGLCMFKRRGSMRGHKRFLKDDSLKINCTILVVVTRSINVPESTIRSDFAMLLENMNGSDIVFDVAGEKFRAHKSVLAARSSKFRSEFSGKKHQEIMVSDIEPKVFKAILKFVYRDELEEEDEKAMASDSSASLDSAYSLTLKLLAAADRYDLPRLRQLCQSYLSNHISVSSVCQILTLAERHHLTELKSVCFRFAAENLQAVICSHGFERFEERCPALQSKLVKYCLQEIVGLLLEKDNDAKNKSSFEI